MLSPDRPLPVAKRAKVSKSKSDASVKRSFVQSNNPTTLSFDARVAPKLAKKFPHLYRGTETLGEPDVVQDNAGGVAAVPASSR